MIHQFTARKRAKIKRNGKNVEIVAIDQTGIDIICGLNVQLSHTHLCFHFISLFIQAKYTFTHL